jgi:hypothetical protein
MKKLLIVVALAWTLAPSTARADWLFTPNVGGVFGGPAAGGATWGASLAWMNAGILGAEADLGFASNNLFDTDEADLLGIDRDFFDAQVTTFMGNVLVGYPVGGTSGNGIRPFFAAGLGLIRSNVDTADDLFESSNNEFGMDLGAGAFGFVTDSIGFRGDIRWYYMFDEPELEFDLLDAGVVNRVDVPTVDLVDIDIDRDFWRATGGVTFRW